MTASSMILAPFAALYGAIIETHAALYRRGIINVSRLDAPVISVGNITTGGTGKTPLVEYIARAAAAEGHRVCILTRGYRRKNPKQRVLVSDGRTIMGSEIESGDEPRVLAEHLQGIAAVISDADRFAAGQWAIAELGSDVFILDDGFQHLQLARDLNVVTIDATDAWGNGHLLPRGRLRERPGGLARSDCIVITRADQADDLNSIKSEIERVSNRCPLFTSRMRVRGLRRVLQATASVEIATKPEVVAPIAAFAGIGNQRSFSRQLQNEGYEPVSISVFPDHHRYSQRDIGGIVAKAKLAGARSLITTAKDAVKLRDFSLELPCYVLDIEICIDEEQLFVEMIRAAISRQSPTNSRLWSG
jgi:tetraacyldisaccharide 4'-kinase